MKLLEWASAALFLMWFSTMSLMQWETWRDARETKQFIEILVEWARTKK